MLKRLLLSHSPAYFFVIPLLCFAVVYSAVPFLNVSDSSHMALIHIQIPSGWQSSRLLMSFLWFVPAVLTAMFIPMLTSRFAMFEKGMFLNSLLWLAMIPAYMSLCGNWHFFMVSALILPLYYFLFGMYKSEFPLHLLFNATLIISAASLIWIPVLFFVLLIWAGWLFYQPFRFRAYLFSITALVLPYFFVLSWFFLTDQLQNTAINTEWLMKRGAAMEKQHIFYLAAIAFFTLFGVIRLAAPGTVKKIGIRKSFNYSLFVFVCVAAMLMIKNEVELNVFLLFPASIIINSAFTHFTRGWSFAVMFWLFAGAMLYFPFGNLLFR